jgi:Mor family transcriptional regulator
MNPNFIAALFISLGMAPVQATDSFKLEFCDGILEVTVNRGSGSIERLVLHQVGVTNDFDNMELFDPKRMTVENRNQYINDLHGCGRNQYALARLFQMSESSICKIIKKGIQNELQPPEE